MPSASAFSLFPFQEEAAEDLRAAALNWVETVVSEGPPKYGGTTIPFLGQLKAVTGSGKTPVLARVVGGLGDAVILWTSRSSAVVEQTFNNLRGKYRSMLPSTGVEILRDIPSQTVWRQLVESEHGVTIWVVTVASWNEAESAKAGGSAEARLNLHRPHPDWAGDLSPWEQLRTSMRRPLWVVSDESHNQSAVQLDLLADLRPKGFFMASATPLVNDLFQKWGEALEADGVWASRQKASTVRVQTRDVVDAELLKTTIEVVDYNSGTEESLNGALRSLKQLDKAVDAEGATCTPRAIYVVEKSNPSRGSAEEARPVAIWKYLRKRGVSADEIAIYTDTKVLPEGAERVTSLSALHDRYRHIIFNQALQEGWDDPEAYVCYFDGVTKSFVRIRQIVGRVLRQPEARRYAAERLNTATLIINTPADSYETVISDLRTELRLYAPEDEPNFIPIRIKTRKDPLEPIPVKKGHRNKLTLPRVALKAPDMSTPIKKIRSVGSRPWATEFLEAPGLGRLTVVTLAANDEKERHEYIDVIRSARTNNGAYLRRQIQQRNRAALNSIHPDNFLGPAFEQSACQNSQAQKELADLADEVVAYFEDRVQYQPDPDPERVTWVVGEHRPRGSDRVVFKRAAHGEYAKADFNPDELGFAYALDEYGKGTWTRNPTTSELGFAIPLPAKVGDSTRFFPDFLWWIDGLCWAIDPTGRHLINEKVRGKLIALDDPRVALMSRGKVSTRDWTPDGKDGWSVVVARHHLSPTVEFFEEFQPLLKYLHELAK